MPEQIDQLMQRWGCRTSASTLDSVMIPRPILEQLIKLAFGRHIFSEKGYLDTYPDIAQALAHKAFLSGKQHYMWDGIKEGRTVEDPSVDPARYLGLNPDLKEASGLSSDDALCSHWLEIGWLEGRRTS